MQAIVTSAKNTASNPPHRYVAAVPRAAVAALYSDSRSNLTTSAVGIKKRPTRGAKKPPEGGYTVRSSCRIDGSRRVSTYHATRAAKPVLTIHCVNADFKLTHLVAFGN